MTVTVISFLVMVPVLSEQITLTQPETQKIMLTQPETQQITTTQKQFAPFCIQILYLFYCHILQDLTFFCHFMAVSLHARHTPGHTVTGSF